MIVTSLRCYLNILTQIMTRDQLLDAQYYIADKIPKVRVDDLPYLDRDIDGNYESKEIPGVEQASPFCVAYATEKVNLNIQSLLTSFDIDIDKISKSKDPLDRYYARITDESFMMAMYANVISNIKKDKLFIMIFMDEATVRYGADIVCNILSDAFGQDVTFIDPQYRPYVRGRVTYVGNKPKAEQVILDIKRKIRIGAFMAALAQSNVESNKNNMDALLVAYENIEDTIDLYNSLWPDDPLPSGNYTNADVKELIIRRAIDERSVSAQRLPNMRMINNRNNFCFNR